MKYLLGLASGLSSMFCILIGYAIAEQANASSLLTTVLMSAAAGPTTPPTPTTSTSRHSSDAEKSSLTVTPDYIMGPEDVLEITVEECGSF